MARIDYVGNNICNGLAYFALHRLLFHFLGLWDGEFSFVMSFFDDLNYF